MRFRRRTIALYALIVDFSGHKLIVVTNFTVTLLAGRKENPFMASQPLPRLSLLLSLLQTKTKLLMAIWILWLVISPKIRFRISLPTSLHNFSLPLLLITSPPARLFLPVSHLLVFPFHLPHSVSLVSLLFLRV